MSFCLRESYLFVASSSYIFESYMHSLYIILYNGLLHLYLFFLPNGTKGCLHPPLLHAILTTTLWCRVASYV